MGILAGPIYSHTASSPTLTNRQTHSTDDTTQRSSHPTDEDMQEKNPTTRGTKEEERKAKNPRVYNSKVLTFISASGSTYWVDDDEKGNGSKVNPAGNITFVLTHNVTTDATINVKPGVYNASIETFPLNFTDYPRVTLNATGSPSETIINSTESTVGINVTSNRIMIEGFTIANHTNAITLTGSSDCMIANNTITSNSKNGIYLTGGSNNTIKNNKISNNNAYGINVTQSNENSITGNTITESGGVQALVCI